ncbi:Predicted metal-binding protein [Alkalispirochaeta americana]|uniref:Predicted metal-binding protein n=1 Tax=Alkalispirochaeta americana TaxID=159291 RepID=A0A1N6T0W1_9SPIO|nr:DUF2284 domain-containing protein [Alkalispirochaeta americana]SIQ46970.1 Predicted metal-binding protein [Alkalispirochaeta americana]
MSDRDYITQRHVHLTSPEELFRYYAPHRVEGYCRECPLYGRFWSCPPHPFSGRAYLSPFSQALLLAERITRNPAVPATRTLEEIFQEARRLLGEELRIFVEGKENLEVLIAGNCYHCPRCSREEGQPCRFPEKRRYSLESLGFLVSDMIQEKLALPLEWPSQGQEPAALVAVALVVAKDGEVLRELL